MDGPVRWIVVGLMLLTTQAYAQPFCPGPYCGSVDPRMPHLDPYGYRRGPVGDWVDRCFYCQGPIYPSVPRYPNYRGYRNIYPTLPYLPPYR